jgi:cell division protein FtsB
MVIVIGVRCAALQKTLTESQAKEAELTAELKTETDRTQQIEEYGKYTKTQKYIEEVAKDKLGLVHDDETIFKNEDSSK